MHNVLYLICIKNPFEKKPFLFCKTEEKIFYTREVYQLKNFEKIICFGFEEIIEDLRTSNLKINQTIYDIVTAIKLITGKPKLSFKLGNEAWALRNIIGKELESTTFKWLNELIQLKEVYPTRVVNFNDRLDTLMHAYEKSCNVIFEQLELKNEKDRYYQLEVPIYNIFIKVQLEGISVNQKKLDIKLLGLKKEYYSALKYLELNYDLLSYDINSTLTLENVKQHYSDVDFPNELEFDFWEYAKMMSELGEPFFSNLIVSKDSKHDYDALLKYSFDKYKKIYPQFDVMGTVTGRILIIKPGIQYLKKSSRSFFEPEEDSEFLYADFDRFEPGILAQLSGDSKLRELYNSGDIYNNLSLLLFDNIENRKLAKTIFLAFSYGMSQINLTKLVYSISKSEDKVSKAEKFFREFSHLVKWKAEICEEARVNGFSDSIMGNKRYLEKENYINYNEQRWIPNQKIQGTASVIFKKSLSSLNNKYSSIKLLIPMHDAILVEVKKTEVEDAKKVILEEFKNNFQEVCPDIKTSASFENFSS